jgi:hypothetical protein
VHRLLLALWIVLAAACSRGHFVESSQYVSREVAGFRVLVSPEEAKATDSAELLEEIDDKLSAFRALVRMEVYDALRSVPIWIERGPEKGRAMAGYHGVAYVRAHALNPDKARAIEIVDARAFLAALRGTSPMALVHELAHAYHDRILGYDDAAVRNSFDAAVRSGRYEHVRTRYGKTARAYALEGAGEYFAEITEAYLGVNDYEPFDRRALESFDPQGFRLMESTWGSALVSP